MKTLTTITTSVLLGGLAAAPAAHGAPQETGTLLSATFGVDEFGGLGACSVGDPVDGLPVVFDRPLDISSVDPEDFVVVTASGDRVTPGCATFFPSANRDERQTILTQGQYGAPGASPVRVEIVGSIQSADRRVNYQGTSITVVPFEVGAVLVYAQRLPLARQLGRPDQCPRGTAQVIQLAFGSNAGNQWPVNLLANFVVELEDGNFATPFAFADTTVDNYLELCLNERSPGVHVDVDALTVPDASGQLNQVPLFAPVQ